MVAGIADRCRPCHEESVPHSSCALEHLSQAFPASCSEAAPPEATRPNETESCGRRNRLRTSPERSLAVLRPPEQQKQPRRGLRLENLLRERLKSSAVPRHEVAG